MLLHADLFVSSMDRSLAFYSDCLGCAVVDDGLVEGDLPRFLSNQRYTAMRLVLLKLSPLGARIELIELLEPSRVGAERFSPPPHHGSLTLLVQGMEERIDQLRSAGVEPVSSIFRVELPRLGPCSVVFYRDPDGHMIELLEPGEAARAPLR